MSEKTYLKQAELEKNEAVRAQRVAIVPWVTTKPVGSARLLALARELGIEHPKSASIQ